MKENLKKFDNRKKFLLLSDLHRIVYGFIKARGALQQHIIKHLGNI